MKSTGQCMREARERAHLSSRELARRTGISHSTISLLELGKRDGRLDTVEMLADALGLSIDEYVGHKVLTKEDNKCAEEKSTSQISE